MAEEKPRIELLESGELYTVELCGPIQEQINQIKVCKPNIVIKPCNPIETWTCLPHWWCKPRWWCRPMIWCRPLIGPCIPSIGPCGPWVEGGTCGPVVTVPIGPQLNEVMARLERITAEIEEIKKKIGK